MDNCKICNGKIIGRCRCLCENEVCENGHHTHFSTYHNEYHVGDSDHSKPFNSPDCCSEKKKI